MPSDSKQGQISSLIISLIILVIVIILIVIVCCNYNNTNNTTNNRPLVQNPQRAAALGAGAYKYNQNKNNFGQTMTCTNDDAGDICGRDGLGTPTAWCTWYKGKVECTGFGIGHS